MLICQHRWGWRVMRKGLGGGEALNEYADLNFVFCFIVIICLIVLMIIAGHKALP